VAPESLELDTALLDQPTWEALRSAEQLCHFRDGEIPLRARAAVLSNG
jgi:hypothetical protein